MSFPLDVALVLNLALIGVALTLVVSGIRKRRDRLNEAKAEADRAGQLETDYLVKRALREQPGPH